jgi:electron transfer flavoprotein alpha subunit
MMALVPTRGGAPAAGAADAIAEAGGVAIFVGGGAEAAARERALPPAEAICMEAAIDDIAALVPGLAQMLARLPGFTQSHLILPASVDGRDIAPRLAHALGRPFFAAASRITAEMATLVRFGGREDWIVRLTKPSVLTLLPGIRGVLASAEGPRVIETGELLSAGGSVSSEGPMPGSAATLALGKAQRVVAGGLGLRSAESFERLATLAERLGAALGATRVAVDRGWLDAERQIGVTGASIRPELYLAFGISGAVQHLAGVERPTHTIAVNIDRDCPMMRFADLAVVADAPAVVEAMLRLLSSSGESCEA